MFRIKKSFENENTAIFKIEGDIPNEIVHIWARELRRIIKKSKNLIILEACSMGYIGPKAVKVLFNVTAGNIYLLSCPTSVKNMFNSAGKAANILD